MTQRNRFHEERSALTSEETDAVVRRARVSALGQSFGALLRGLWAFQGNFRRAVDQAYRLRALASLDDNALSALGLARADLPGIVYGWRGHGTPAVLVRLREPLEQPRLPHRQKAA
jgi:uncharacterized protein YjiS (DUF1127 family)